MSALAQPATRISARGALSSSAARILGSGLGFAATLLVARLLGPEQSGVLFATISWALALTILARWGASDRIMIEMAPLRGGWRAPVIAAFLNRQIVSALLRATVLAGLIAGALVLGEHAFAIKPPISWPFLMALVPATVLLQLASAGCKAMQRLDEAFLFELVLPPGMVLAIMALAMLAGDASRIAMAEAAYLVSTLVAALACLAIGLRGYWHGRSLRPRLSDDKDRARDFALIEMSAFTMLWLPMLALPFLVPSAEVGIFNMALRLVAPIGLLSSTIYLLAVPALATARRQRNWQAWHDTLVRCRMMMAVVSALFLLAMVLVGPWVLDLAGEGFAAAYRPLFIMAGCYAAGTALGPSGTALSVIGAERLSRTVNLAATGLALLAFAPVVRLMGTDGAALVTGGAFLGMKLSLLVLEIRQTGRLDWAGGAK